MSSKETLTTLAAVVKERGGHSRPEQERMAAAVADALAEENNLVVQAGTGVGKSLGYLVPLMLRAANTGTTQMVATASLALQRQIISQDAPLVRDVIENEIGKTVGFALLKGWSNYLCRYRLSGGYGQEEMLWDEAEQARIAKEQIEELREWAEETQTGDRDEVPFPVGNAAWAQVSLSRRECLGNGCPLVNECFPQRAKDTAFAADLVVTNHALLGVYVNGRPDVLPEFSALVVDEAHDLMSRVRSQGTEQLSPAAVGRAARRVQAALSSAIDLEEARDRLESVFSDLEPGLMSLRPMELNQAVRKLDDAVKAAKRELSANSTTDGGAQSTADVQLARASLDGLQGALEAWAGDPAQTITWVSETRANTMMLNMAPLEVAWLLRNNLFNEHPVIFTSATLALGGTFDQFTIQTGLRADERPCIELDVGTSFDTVKQGILYAASHLPPPGREGIAPETLDEFVDLVVASGGGALGLFSSQRGAQAAAERLREETNLEVLLQGEDNLSSLVENFRQDRDSVLVGTLSLWQGVDVPGDSCRLVTIDRIPFGRPDDPVSTAQQRSVAQQGRNPFLEVTLAPAALLMAQGAGRLLRTATDRGVIAILDSRVATKSYGGYIHRSLMPYWNTSDPQVTRQALRRLAAAN